MSIPFNCSGFGFLLSPYNEIIGNPVLESFPSTTCSPASAVPRKPCSGANIFWIAIFFSNRKSTKCVLLERIPVWLVTIPIFFLLILVNNGRNYPLQFLFLGLYCFWLLIKLLFHFLLFQFFWRNRK